MKNLTYRELRDKINSMSDEQLDSEVRVVDQWNDFHPVWGLRDADGSEPLPTGHPYICQN